MTERDRIEEAHELGIIGVMEAHGRMRDEPPAGWRGFSMQSVVGAVCHRGWWWEAPDGRAFCATCHPKPWLTAGPPPPKTYAY